MNRCSSSSVIARATGMLALALATARIPIAAHPETSPDPATVFLRYRTLAPWEGVVESAVVTYVNETGVSVSLVAAVHDADANHFGAVQEALAAFPLVLYEGWAPVDEPPGADPPVLPRPVSALIDAVNGLYSAVKAVLSFRHVDQWDTVDYSSPSFVNADMTLAQFRRLCTERSELRVEMLNSIRLLPEYAGSLVRRSVPTEVDDVVELLALPADWYQAARYLFAREIVEANNLFAESLARGSSLPTVTIQARNELVINALREAFSRRENKVAIYYGAAHMPELEARLSGLGFRRSEVRWIDCWDVRRWIPR